MIDLAVALNCVGTACSYVIVSTGNFETVAPPPAPSLTPTHARSYFRHYTRKCLWRINLEVAPHVLLPPRRLSLTPRGRLSRLTSHTPRAPRPTPPHTRNPVADLLAGRASCG